MLPMVSGVLQSKSPWEGLASESQAARVFVYDMVWSGRSQGGRALPALGAALDAWPAALPPLPAGSPPGAASQCP